MDLLEELCNNKNLDFDQTSKLLAEFRILTREKNLSSKIVNAKSVEILVNFSKQCHTEAQKSLSNLILNYKEIRAHIIKPYVDCVKTRFETILNDHAKDGESTQPDSKQLLEVLYYDLRIIFLLSSLCPELRSDENLVDLIFKFVDKQADEFSPDNYSIVVESLKALFNLTIKLRCMNVNISFAGDVIEKLFKHVGTEMDLTTDSKTGAKLDPTETLRVSLIHLLTNMPKEVYLKLSDEDVNKILNYMDEQLKNSSSPDSKSYILPALNICSNICLHNDAVRKRWFNEILASNKDFERRPEEYDNLRGRLAKLMTSVDISLKDIAAEFLHSLCGGDTEKFVIYAGFGNSAGFLTSRGLIPSCGGFRGNGGSDEDSEYKELRERIDPITGKLDTPKPNPMATMSEEEKEFHANELADAITRLQNLGVVKPMGVDADGKITEIHPSSFSNNGKEERKKKDDLDDDDNES